MTPGVFIWTVALPGQTMTNYALNGRVAMAGVSDVWCLKQQASTHCVVFNLASWPDDSPHKVHGPWPVMNVLGILPKPGRRP